MHKSEVRTVHPGVNLLSIVMIGYANLCRMMGCGMVLHGEYYREPE